MFHQTVPTTLTGPHAGYRAGLLIAALLSCSSAAQEATQEARILVFTRTAAYRHASIPAAIAALRARAAREGMGLEATEDVSAFTRANLSRYRAVVFLSTTGNVLEPRHQAALEAFVRDGGGFVGIHSASDTEYDWPWYGELVGAYFAGHPPGIRSGTLIVATPGHPATAALPNSWTRSDEWYDLRDLQPGITVLLEIDESSYKTPAETPALQPRPIAWHRDFDGGRTFYTALGHTEESWSELPFVEHVWGGVRWVLGS